TASRPPARGRRKPAGVTSFSNPPTVHASSPTHAPNLGGDSRMASTRRESVQTSLRIRWMVRYGLPRGVLAVQARRGPPLARFLLGRARGDEMYRLFEQIRQRGRLARRPFLWVSADHEICRSILRDDRFGVTNPVNIPLPQPFPAVMRRTDPGL